MPRAAVDTPTIDRQSDTAIELTPLTEDEIREQTDPNSFGRGRGYARSKRIFQPIRRGNLLRARCHGSSGGPYLVEATLAVADQAVDENPIDFRCTCPRGDFCKHVVALLLTWIEAPETFDVRPPIAELLASKSKEELIALIELIVVENPDIEELLELPAPVSGTSSGEPIDAVALRRQIATTLRDDAEYGYPFGRGGRYRDYYDEDDYYAGTRIAKKLQRLIALGHTYAEAGHWRNALQVYATMAEEVAPQIGNFQDDEGELRSLVTTCDRGLADVLDAQGGLPEDERLSAKERERLIDNLLLIWDTDIESGGLDISDEGPEAIARSATLEEQRRVAAHLRQQIDPGGGGEWSSRNWTNQGIIWFLSQLRGDAGLSAEEKLEEYRKAELWEDAAMTLLQLHRVEEAIALAARRLTSSIVLLRFADQLVATEDPQRIEQAIALVDACLWEREGRNGRDDFDLSEWLEKRFAEHGRPQRALELARRRFKTSPTKQTYDAVKAAALLPDQPDAPWPKLRAELLATLNKRGDWLPLIDIHLEENEVAEAIAALKRSERGNRSTLPVFGWAYSGSSYEERVAKAAEPDFPDEAVRIYRKLADQQIAGRQRSYYHEAARYLERVKHLLESTGRAETWQTLISELRDQHTTLRALRDELNALGLG